MFIYIWRENKTSEETLKIFQKFRKVKPKTNKCSWRQTAIQIEIGELLFSTIQKANIDVH